MGAFLCARELAQLHHAPLEQFDFGELRVDLAPRVDGPRDKAPDHRHAWEPQVRLDVLWPRAALALVGRGDALAVDKEFADVELEPRA